MSDKCCYGETTPLSQTLRHFLGHAAYRRGLSRWRPCPKSRMLLSRTWHMPFLLGQSGSACPLENAPRLSQLTENQHCSGPSPPWKASGLCRRETCDKALNVPCQHPSLALIYWATCGPAHPWLRI